MVAVTAGELSPIVTGLIYCGVIDNCNQVCAVDRAGQWTSAMDQKRTSDHAAGFAMPAESIRRVQRRMAMPN
jgi:hypothetical protein